MRDFKKLDVWRRVHKFTLEIYKQTGDFPRDELYGLSSQIRRAAVSIPANVAEGYGRASDFEFARFLDIAIGSSSELSYHILLAKDLDYLKVELFQIMAQELKEIQMMLTALRLKVYEGRNRN